MNGRPEGDSTSEWVDDAFESARVLIVDDVEANVTLLRRILRAMGIDDVESTTVPTDAVPLFRRHKPDLVLLDLHMPGLDGVGVLRAIRAVLAATDFVPIIVLTADATDDAKQRALGAGANDFVTKPFDQTEVMLRVKNQLRTRKLYVRAQEQNSRLQATIDRQRDRERRRQRAAELKITRIRHAIDNGLVRVAFQPIVELTTGQVIGHEALARFDAPGAESPAVWFAEASEVGLSYDLELHAIHLALERAPRVGFVSINASPRTAMTMALLDEVAAHGGERVVVEITEHTKVDDYATVAASFHRLQQIGVRIAMDDLGAGYSGLQHILQLSPDIVKLDIELVRGIDSDPAKRALVASFVQLSRELATMLIAEGIETTEELRTLQRLGVTCGQGFLLGHPTHGPVHQAVARGLGTHLLP